MKLKYIVKDLTEVPESLREAYIKREDGAYVLDAEGATDKSKVDEFRNTNVELMKKLEGLKDIDPAKYAELMDLDRQKREKELIEKGEVDKVIAERVKGMKTEHEKELKKLADQLGISNRQLETLLIDNAVKSAAVQHGVLPTALDDVVLRAKANFSIVDGKPLMKDGEGNVVYGDDGVTPQSVEGWTKGLKTNAPHLFAGFNGSGASGSGRGTPQQTANMTAIQKISAGLANIQQGR